MGSHTGFALVPLQNFTHSRRQESPANPPGLNTFHHKHEHTRELMDILQKEEKREKMDLLSTSNCCLNPGEGQGKVPARVLNTFSSIRCKGHQCKGQCKGQSTPFFQITAVSLLAYQPLLGAFPHSMGVIHGFLSPERQGYCSSVLQAGMEERGEEGPGSSALV